MNEIVAKSESEVEEEFDEERSVVSLLPPRVRQLIALAQEKAPNYFNKTEMILWGMVRPSDTADGLRISFWKEYNRAQDLGKKMVMQNVFGPFMHHEIFYRDFLTSAGNVAWMLCIPTHYLMSLEAQLQHGKNSLGKIMRMPLFDKEGNLKTKEAQIFLKAYEMLDNRVRGAVVQRIESKSASININQTLSGDPDDLRKELEQRRTALGLIEVSDPNKQ